MKLFRAFLLTALVLATAGSAHAFLGLFSQNEALKAENGQVRIPLAQVSDGKAHYFRFRGPGRRAQILCGQKLRRRGPRGL